MDKLKVNQRFISVVIPTIKRNRLLARALESLATQSYPMERFQVIVVDNGCMDDTMRLCQNLTSTIPSLIYIPNPTPGLHSCRHVGLRRAQGEIVTFADDDIRAFPSWLEGVNEGFSDSQVALVGGKAVPEYEEPPPRWIDRLWRTVPEGRILGAYSLVDLGDRVRTVSSDVVFGCNYSVRRDLAIIMGGFNPDGFPKHLIRYRGDGEMVLGRLLESRGFKILYHPKASVYHFVSSERLTHNYIAWRYYIQGISSSYTDIRRSNYLRKLDELVEWGKYWVRLASRLADPLGRMCAQNYHRGYLYHRSEVRRDPSLLEWVLRSDYWEATPNK